MSCMLTFVSVNQFWDQVFIEVDESNQSGKNNIDSRNKNVLYVV